MTYTVGDLVVTVGEVGVAGKPVTGSHRIADGETLVTGPSGRARLTLDDGAIVALHGSTELSLSKGEITIASGRAFVQARQRASVAVRWGNASTRVVESSVAFDRSAAEQSRA